MSDWQPIENYEKPVLSDGEDEVYGSYVLGWPVRGGVARMRWWDGGSIHDRVFQNFIDDGGRGCTPTHYMLLPEPPEAGE